MSWWKLTILFLLASGTALDFYHASKGNRIVKKYALADLITGVFHFILLVWGIMEGL